MILQIPSDSSAGTGLLIRRRAALRSGNRAPAGQAGFHFGNDEVHGADRLTAAEAVKVERRAKRRRRREQYLYGWERREVGWPAEGFSPERPGEVGNTAPAIGG